MIVYLDSSAYVKNYLREAGRKTVAKLMAQADMVATQELARVEITSAFERACRERRLDAEQLRRAHLQFTEDWPSTLVVATTDSLLREAVALLKQFPLKAYDAMHLAAACALGESIGMELIFAGFDAQQNRAARQLGLTTPNSLP